MLQRNIIQPVRGRNYDTCYTRMSLEDIMLRKTSQSPKDKCCVVHVYEGPTEVKLRAREHHGGFQGLGKGGQGAVVQWAQRLTLGISVLELDGGDCTTM